MGCYIVPNVLRDQIYAKVDAEIEKVPEAAPDREHFYHQLLEFFNEHGYVPEFGLHKNDEPGS
jgi:hypothetical protein